MKKYIVLLVAAFAVHGSLAADRLETAELSPMVLVELQASMKADLILAERYITMEIKDDLDDRSSTVIEESLNSETAVLPVETVVVSTDWSIAAQE